MGPNTQVLLSGFVAMGLFLVSEDFSLRQLLHINSPEVTFRSGKFKRYEHLWFWRQDDRSPAEFLNVHRNEVDALVVSIHARTLPYYLNREMDFAYYCSREKEDADAWRYGDIARSKGKLELWTGRPLLGTEQELRTYTERIHSLYLVRPVSPSDHDFDIDHVWSDRLIAYKRVFLSSNGSTEIVKVSLKQPAQKIDSSAAVTMKTVALKTGYQEIPSEFRKSVTRFDVSWRRESEQLWSARTCPRFKSPDASGSPHSKSIRAFQPVAQLREAQIDERMRSTLSSK